MCVFGRIDFFNAKRQFQELHRAADDLGMPNHQRLAEMVNAGIDPSANDRFGTDAGGVAQGDGNSRFGCLWRDHIVILARSGGWTKGRGGVSNIG